MKIRKIEYQDGEVVLEATVALPESSEPRPLILVFHAWDGKGAFVEEKAAFLADLGYVGCAVDLYGKGVFLRTLQEKMDRMQPFLSDRSKLQKRILSYKSLLPHIPEADPAKIGAVGFCFGGLAALDLARAGDSVAGVVSFHGLLRAPDARRTPVQAKILALHGVNDPMVPPEEVLEFQREMEAGGADWQLHVFGRTMHAFTNPEANAPDVGAAYQPDSAGRAFIYMQDFFRELFPSISP